MLQFNNIEAGEVFLQLHQVFWAGAAPGIDGLIVVAYYGEGLFSLTSVFTSSYWARLVSWYSSTSKVADALLPFGEDLWLLPEQHDWRHYQVIKVYGVVGFECSLVAFIEHGYALLAGAVGGAYCLAGFEQ